MHRDSVIAGPSGQRRHSSLAQLLMKSVLTKESEQADQNDFVDEEPIVYRHVLTNEALHIALYYNFYYSIIYVLTNVFVILWKFNTATDDEWVVVYVTPPIAFTWLIVESIRLWLGFIGNLQEKVPHLAAFFFLTFFPQLFLTLYLAFLQIPTRPWETVTGCIMIAFISTEVLLGYITMQSLIQSQTIRFRLDFFDPDADKSEDEQLRKYSDTKMFQTDKSAVKTVVGASTFFDDPMLRKRSI